MSILHNILNSDIEYTWKIIRMDLQDVSEIMGFSY